MRSLAICSLICAASLTSCSSTKPQESHPVETTIRKLDAELDNFKFELHAGKMDSELLQERVQEHTKMLEDFAQSLRKAEAKSQKMARDEVERLMKEWQELTSEQRKLQKSIDQLNRGNQTASKAVETLQKEVVSLKRDVADLSSALRSVSRMIGSEKDSSVTYYVRAGDSLGIIAKKYNTTVAAIKEANDLKRDTIYVGQKLSIPR